MTNRRKEPRNLELPIAAAAGGVGAAPPPRATDPGQRASPPTAAAAREAEAAGGAPEALVAALRRVSAAREVAAASAAAARGGAQPADVLARSPESSPAPPGAEAGDDPLAEFFFSPDEATGELEALAPLPDAAAHAADEPLLELLGFRLGDEFYAVELAEVREIVRVPPITEVPRAPPDVIGVMSLRGEVLPVFEVRRRLRLPPRPPESPRRARVVIVDTGVGRAGVLVDSVEQVIRLKASSLEAPPAGLGAGGEGDELLGIGRADERLYVVVDLVEVLKRSVGEAKP